MAHNLVHHRESCSCYLSFSTEAEFRWATIWCLILNMENFFMVRNLVFSVEGESLPGNSLVLHTWYGELLSFIVLRWRRIFYGTQFSAAHTTFFWQNRCEYSSFQYCFMLFYSCLYRVFSLFNHFISLRGSSAARLPREPFKVEHSIFRGSFKAGWIYIILEWCEGLSKWNAYLLRVFQTLLITYAYLSKACGI